MPSDRRPVVNNELAPAWLNYLKEIEIISGSLELVSTSGPVAAVSFADLTGASSAVAVATAVNELKTKLNAMRAALVAANLMDL
jgi:hypothetical protein